MIDPKERDIGRAVIYRPSEWSAKPERGRITSFDSQFVFVRYERSEYSVATNRDVLFWADQGSPERT